MPIKGMVTTKGSPIFEGQVSNTDAVVFERIRSGGAVFIGRSNSPEFGLGGHTFNSVYGTTGNAFDPDKTAGGSSGGAAVAVALRMLPVADDSDMMGSLRTPAAFNNVFGMRTTPTALAALSLVIPVAIGSQNCSSTSRRSDGAPGDRIAPRPVKFCIHPTGRPINTSLVKGGATTG